MDEALRDPRGGPSGLGVWLRGARPRTLVASICPVLVGTAVAASGGRLVPWRALAVRVGPVRLVASGLASPSRVKLAAVLAFAVAGFAGLALALAVDPRLLLVGVVCVAAAVLYTGGPRPYGYAGFGELAVLVFFGLVATTGTAYVQTERLEGLALAASVPVGLGAVAILLANNIRDLDGDRAAGKRTLVVRLGRARSRSLFLVTVVAMFVVVA